MSAPRVLIVMPSWVGDAVMATPALRLIRSHLPGSFIGALMIDLTLTSECVGQVGINHGPLFPEKELGWQVYEGYEGNGYATEAARALRDWAFGALGLRTLVSYIDPGNSRSAAVAERLGAVLDRTAPRQDPDDLVYRHRAPPKAT